MEAPEFYTQGQFIEESYDLNNTNTSSSKSTISQKSNENDTVNHLNIKAHIESVNQEISSLDNRMEKILLSKHSSDNCYRTPVDIIRQSSPPKLPNVKPQIESETEHIYETIPEDFEAEPIYCSPYEGDDKNVVEKWLKINSCHKKSTKQQNNKIVKHSSSGEDCENSSSAYNTGGSTNSNNLTLELTPTKKKSHKYEANGQCCQQKSPQHHQQTNTLLTAKSYQCLMPKQGKFHLSPFL